MVSKLPTGNYSVFDFNPRTGRFEERRDGRGSSYSDKSRGRDFGKRRLADSYGKNLPSGGYGGGSRMSRAARALARIGAAAARRHPTIRAINTAFDMAYEFGPEWGYGEKIEPDPTVMPEVPPGWWVDCFNPAIPFDIGYGVAGGTWAACPGGNCTGTYTNPGDVIEGDVELTTFGRTCAACAGGIRYRKRALSFGPANAAIGTPLGRYAQKMKICATQPTNPSCTDSRRICEPAVFRIPRPYTPTRPIPMVRPPIPAITESTIPAPDVTAPPRAPLKPYQEPALDYEVAPGGSWSNRPHNRVKPGPGTRERKGQAFGRTAGKLLAALYDATTEASEIVDILYDNLGKRCKGAKSMSEKANCVYKNIGTLNIAGSMAGIIGNHIEDKFWGRFYGAVGKHTDFGSMLPGTGPARDPGPVRNLSLRS